MQAKRQYTYYYDSLLEVNKENRFVLFKKESFFPSIKIEVLTLEKHREDLGAFEMAILKLISSNVNSIQDIATLTGFTKPDKIKSTLEEMIGLGWIIRKGNSLSISNTGKMCVETGSQMVETSSSLLLCGITGRLLPKEMYMARQVEVKDLSSMLGFKYLIDEMPKISLESLSLQNINKKDYNIKDEVESISEYLDYTQVFLEADIMLYFDRKMKSVIAVNGKKITWTLNNDNLAKEIDFETTHLRGDKKEIEKYFLQHNFKNVEVTDLNFHSVQVKFSTIVDKVLKVKFNSIPLLAYIGCSDFVNQKNYLLKPIAFNKLPFKMPTEKWKFNLKGQTFYLVSSSEEVLKYAEIYRAIYSLKQSYFDLPFSKDKQTYKEYMNLHVHTLAYNKSDIKSIVKDYYNEKTFEMLFGKEVNE